MYIDIVRLGSDIENLRFDIEKAGFVIEFASIVIEFESNVIEFASNVIEFASNVVEICPSDIEFSLTDIDPRSFVIEFSGSVIEIFGPDIESRSSEIELFGCVIEFLGPDIEILGPVIEPVGVAIESGRSVIGELDGGGEFFSRGIGFSGFVKRVNNTGDSSVNHVIIDADNGSVTHTVVTDTNNDDHRLTNLTGIAHICHVLYAGTSRSYIDNAAQAEFDADAKASVVAHPARHVALIPGSGAALACVLNPSFESDPIGSTTANHWTTTASGPISVHIGNYPMRLRCLSMRPSMPCPGRAGRLMPPARTSGSRKMGIRTKDGFITHRRWKSSEVTKFSIMFLSL